MEMQRLVGGKSFFKATEPPYFDIRFFNELVSPIPDNDIFYEIFSETT
jgi:hypothetical protein